MARSSQAQGDHDNMVLSVANKYNRDGHSSIRADHPQFPGQAPGQIGNHVPDVTSYQHNTPVICEVETRDSIGTDHTYSQLLTFRNAATSVNGLLHVALPLKTDLAYAKSIVEGDWNIAVDKWWYGVES